VTGQHFQLYPAKEGYSESNIQYHDDVRVLHIEPITHQEVKFLQGISPSDLSKLEVIAATSEMFKNRDLDATLMVHATERKHDDRYHFYWYFIIPNLVAILLTIMVCYSYPCLFRKLLYNIRCNTHLVVIPQLEINKKFHQKSNQNSNLITVSYKPMNVKRNLRYLPTLYEQWLEAEIFNRQENCDGRCDFTISSSSYLVAQRRNKEIPRTPDGK